MRRLVVQAVQENLPELVKKLACRYLRKLRNVAPGILNVDREPVRPLGIARGRRFDYRVEYRLLAGKVIVKRRSLYPNRLCDLPDADRIVTILRKKLQCLIEYLLLCVLLFHTPSKLTNIR